MGLTPQEVVGLVGVMVWLEEKLLEQWEEGTEAVGMMELKGLQVLVYQHWAELE